MPACSHPWLGLRKPSDTSSEIQWNMGTGAYVAYLSLYRHDFRRTTVRLTGIRIRI